MGGGFKATSFLVLAIALTVAAAAAAAAPYSPTTTAPAFLWSPHQLSSSDRVMEGVNYQTISSKDLAKAIMSEGGWSNSLCSGKKLQQPLDLALIFVGRELLSSDISASNNADPALLNLLKVSFTRSNFSMGFPYVTVTDERMESALVSGFVESCEGASGISNFAFSESCSVGGENFEKLSDLDAVHEYLISKMEKRQTRQADVVLFCHGHPKFTQEIQQRQRESETLSKLISSAEMSGAKYAVLYVSDPIQSIQYPSHRELERFLAEGAAGNGSLNSTICDEVCQIKSSLLEGVFVGIVLLIILISGLCCMMGIDTPTRFETPQES